MKGVMGKKHLGAFRHLVSTLCVHRFDCCESPVANSVPEREQRRTMGSDTEEKPSFTLTKLVRPKARQRSRKTPASGSVTLASSKNNEASSSTGGTQSTKPVTKSAKRRAHLPSFQGKGVPNVFLASSSDEDSPKKNEKPSQKQTNNRRRHRRKKSSPIPLPKFSTPFLDGDSSSDDEILQGGPIFLKNVSSRPTSPDPFPESANDKGTDVSDENQQNATITMTGDPIDPMSPKSSPAALLDREFDLSKASSDQKTVEPSVRPQQSTSSSSPTEQSTSKGPHTKDNIRASIVNQQSRQSLEEITQQGIAEDKQNQSDKKNKAQPPGRKRSVVLSQQRLKSILQSFLEGIDPSLINLKDCYAMLSTRHNAKLSKAMKAKVKEFVVQIVEENSAKTSSQNNTGDAPEPCANNAITLPRQTEDCATSSTRENQPSISVPVGGDTIAIAETGTFAQGQNESSPSKSQVAKLPHVPSNVGKQNESVSVEHVSHPSLKVTEQNEIGQSSEKAPTRKRKARPAKAPATRKPRSRKPKEPLVPNSIDDVNNTTADTDSRKKRKVCTFCSCCPSCSSNEADVGHSPSATMLSQSDANIERALIRQLQKLEKTAELYAGQENAVRRKLKAHRRDMWKKRERMMSSEFRSWFLPDSEELEQELNQAEQNKRLPAKRAKKATERVFRERKTFQPTLTQLMGGSERDDPAQDVEDKTDIDAETDVVVEEQQAQVEADEEEAPDEGLGHEILEAETGFDSEPDDDHLLSYRLEYGGERQMGTQEEFRGSLWAALMRNEIGATFDDLFVDATELEDDDMRDLENMMFEGNRPGSDHAHDKVSVEMLPDETRPRAEEVIQEILTDHDDLEAVSTVFGRDSWKENMCYVFNVNEDDEVANGIVEMERARKRIETAKAQINNLLDRHIRGFHVAERAARVRLERCSQKTLKSSSVDDLAEGSSEQSIPEVGKVALSDAEDSSTFPAHHDSEPQVNTEVIADGFLPSQGSMIDSPIGQVLPTKDCTGRKDSPSFGASLLDRDHPTSRSEEIIFPGPKTPQQMHDRVASRGRVDEVIGARESIESEVATVVPTPQLDFAGQVQNGSPCRLSSRSHEPASPLITLPA